MSEPDEQMRAAVQAGCRAAIQDGQSREVQHYDDRMRMVAESAVRKVLTDPDPERLKFAYGAVEIGMKDYMAEHGPSWASAHAAQKRLEGPKTAAIGCAGIAALFLAIAFPPILLLLVPLLLIYAYKIGDKASKGG